MNPQLEMILWVSQPLLQLIVMGIMLKRKLRRTFPVFFAYIVSQLLTFLVVFPIRQWGGYAMYFYAYWACEAISLIIGFMVIHEIFLDVFRTYHTLKDLGSVLFKWAALVMLLVAAVVMAASPSSADPLIQSILTAHRCVQVIQCGLVLFLLVFSKYLGVSWRQQSFGISLGFGGYAGMELIMVGLLASGHVKPPTLNLADMIASNVSILVWLGYVAVKSPYREVSGTALTTQRWEQSLTDLRHSGSDDSLIPMFESMVDRAFSKTPNDWSPAQDEITTKPQEKPVPAYARKAVSPNLSSIA